MFKGIDPKDGASRRSQSFTASLRLKRDPWNIAANERREGLSKVWKLSREKNVQGENPREKKEASTLTYSSKDKKKEKGGNARRSRKIKHQTLDGPRRIPDPKSRNVHTHPLTSSPGAKRD